MLIADARKIWRGGNVACQSHGIVANPPQYNNNNVPLLKSNAEKEKSTQ